MKTRIWIVLGLLCLMIASCQKRQDLINKAFEDKNFDEQLAKTEELKAPEEEDPEEEKETTSEVLIDKTKPPVEESNYVVSGTEDSPNPITFSKDPEVTEFSYEEAPVFTLIELLAKNMGLNYIIDPSIKDQSVTMNLVATDNPMKSSDLLDLILKLHDLTMVKRDPFVYIVPISSAEVNPGLEILYGTKPNRNLRNEELVIQLIPLKYIAPSDMATVIKEFLSGSARILEEPKNNLLIIIDKAHHIRKAMELIPIFDVDVLAGKKMVYYELAHVDSVETAGRLQEILSVYGFEEDTGGLSILPIETLNGILVVARQQDIFKELDFWISKFDKEAQFEEEQIFVYHVENTTADNIASTLGQLYGLQAGISGRGAGRGSSAASNRRTTSPNLNPQDDTNRTQDQQQQSSLTNRRQAITGGEAGQPAMIVDEENNAIIFKTTPREYYRIRKDLKKLDILPRQVFLEVTVLSVSLNDTYSLGINWSAGNRIPDDAGVSNGDEIVSSSFIQPSDTEPPAFSGAYTIARATSFVRATINAAKQKGYVNVLQQPHIMAIDNKTANLAVGQDVPIITSTNNISNIGQGNGLSPATSSTIQYRNTGVTLGFTPHINANGIIRLEINLQISEPQPTNAQGGTPISNNQLETEMIVRDGQTVVMGGLIADTETWDRNGVPLLSRIPLLRHFFQTKSNALSKRELIVMITPRLIDSEEKSIEISKEFKEKILKEFESFQTSQN